MDDFKESIIPEWESIAGPIDTNIDGGFDLINSIFIYNSVHLLKYTQR